MGSQITEKSSLILNDVVSQAEYGRSSAFANQDDLTLVVLSIIRREPHSEPCSRKTTRYTLIGTAAIVSAGAKLFYIPISLKMPLGPAFAAGNFTSFFILELWAARGLINDFLGAKSESRLRLLKPESNDSFSKRLLLGLDSTLIALFSQIPSGLAAEYYNSPSLKIIAAVVTIVSGAFFPARSVYLSQMHLFDKPMFNEEESKIIELQKEVQRSIANFRQLLLKLPEDEKNKLIQKVNLARENTDDEKAILAYMNACSFSQTSSPQPPNIVRRTGEKIVDFLGSILTVTFPTGLGLYTYALSKVYVIDSTPFAATSGVVVAGSFAYYSGKSIIHTSRRVYNSAANLITGKRQASLAEQVRPKLIYALRSIGLLINAFSIGAAIVIWGDFLEDYPGWKEYFQVSMSSSIFIIVFTAMLDTVDDIVRTIILSNDKDKKSEWVKLDAELSELENIMVSCPPKLFETFLNKNLKDRYLERIRSAKASINNE